MNVIQKLELVKLVLFKHLNTPLDPDKCPVRIFVQKRLSEMCEAGSLFYLAINYKASWDDLWYKQQRMGKDRIGFIMARESPTTPVLISEFSKGQMHLSCFFFWLLSAFHMMRQTEYHVRSYYNFM